MYRIALIGADGAGKTTIARRLPELLAARCPEVRATYLYMGINAAASKRQLPTTRLVHWIRRLVGRNVYQGGPRTDTAREGEQTPRRKSLLRTTKSLAVLVNRFAEQVYRQTAAQRHIKRGEWVIYDRDYFCDYYAFDVLGRHGDRSRVQRIHGWLLQRFYRKPDLAIYLDAPAEVLYARKGEGTLEILEQRRDDYRLLRGVVPAFVEVDASRELAEVVESVLDATLATFSASDIRSSSPCNEQTTARVS